MKEVFKYCYGFNNKFDFITADKVFRNEINRTNDMSKQCPFQYNR